MRRYVAGRVFQALVTLLMASVLVFALARVLPGDPAQAVLGENATPEEIEGLRSDLGLDQPLVIQYWHWLVDAAGLDLGESIRFRESVTSVIANAFPPTITLLVASMLLGVVLGIALGSIAGLKRGRLTDVLITAGTSTIIGVPNFWFGIMAILVFSLSLGWLPPGGWTSPFEDFAMSMQEIALPAVTLGLALASGLARFTRSSIIEALASPYITTARAKGVPERRIAVRHALRNALIPVLTILGLQFAAVLGGAVVIEVVFAIPGLGRLALGAISTRDFPLIQAILMLLVMVYVVVNLVVDLLHGVVDPRLRKGMA